MNNTILSNYIFLVREAWKVAPLKLPAEIGIKILNNLMTAYSTVWLCYYIVDSMDHQCEYADVIKILVLFLAINLFLALFTQWYMKCRKDREDMKIKQHLHHILYRQAVRVELNRYDDADFYNLYKRAFDCIDKTVEKVFANLINMAGFLAMLFGTLRIMVSIDSALWIFGFLGIFSYLINKSYNIYKNTLSCGFLKNAVNLIKLKVVRSSKKQENVGNSCIIPALLLHQHSYTNDMLY